MKRNKKLISGPGVRYYDHRVGIVNARRPLAVRIFLPLFVTMGLLVGGSYFGYSQFMETRPVLANTSTVEAAPNPEFSESSAPDLKTHQAKEDEMLTKEIKDVLKDMPKNTEWAVSVRDLNYGRMANINADKKLEAASFYKMYLLAPLEKKLYADYWKSYVGKQSINDCVKAMIKSSDNDCPQALGNYIRWDNIDSHNKTLGFTNTTVNTKDGMRTTSKEMSELMYRLQNSMMLSDKARRLVFDALYEQELRQGIPKGCGQDCLVANKTGEINDIKNDAAIVTHGDSKYVLVIMSKGASWDDVADLTTKIDKIMRP